MTISKLYASRTDAQASWIFATSWPVASQDREVVANQITFRQKHRAPIAQGRVGGESADQTPIDWPTTKIGVPAEFVKVEAAWYPDI